MNRPYFKNDLFHYTSVMQNQRARNQQMQKTSAQSNGEPGKDIKQQQINQISNFDPTQALKIQLNNNNQVDIDDQLKQVFVDLKKSKSTPAKDNPRKPIIFTPKSTLKFPQVKNTQNLSSKQQFQSQRKEKWQMWKMRQELTKLMQIQEQKQPEKKEQSDSKKNNSNLQKKQEPKQGAQQKNDQHESTPEQKKVKSRAKTTGKQKKIKKEANYVKTDLKRKYRDRFVGGLNKNLRMITKSGKIKRKYVKGNLNTELEISEGKVYNSYSMSLSKALFVTVDLDGQGEIEDPQKLNYSIPESFQRENLQKLINELFGFQSFRQGQYETIKNILQGKSTLFVSQTASGKSLTYLLCSVIQKGLSIIISPLVSLMLDQIDHLPSDLPAACISSLLNHDQKDKIINMVKQGKIQLLYITPEIFLTDFMYHVRFFPPINFVCIDEAHSLSQLSHSFRASYLSLEDIVLRYLKYKTQKPVVLCLTATANPQTMQSICQKMSIKQKISSKSVINKNLFVTISRQYLGSKYEALFRYLCHPQIRKCKGVLIYCRTKKIMFDVFNFLRNSSAMCYIYHSGLPQKEKVQTIEKFRNGEIRIVIATIALGMGLDFQNLQCVIHINMPKSVENYVQEIGRAGRRQKRAYCHLFLDKFDYFTERNYFLADQLDTKILSQIIKTMKNQTFQLQKRGRKRISQKDHKDQQKKLKRSSIEEKEQMINEQNEKQKIFYQDQNEQIDVKNNSEIKKPEDNIKNDQAEEVQSQLQQQQKVESKSNQQCFLPLNYCKAEAMVQSSGLKQQALLTLFLKIEKLLGKKVIRIFPMTYEVLKIGFFRKNEETIKNQSEIFRKLIQDCKVVKGLIYVPLIKKCNQLNMPPIMLLTQIYGLSNQYSLKMELINDVFVWQHRISSKQTFKLLEDEQNFQRIIHEFNIVQKTALTKFNIFYSLCFNHSSKNLTNILDRNQIISDADALPSSSIIYSFDKYFSQQTNEFYKEIIDECQVEGQEKSQTNVIQASYLPITGIDDEVIKQVAQCVQLFMRHILLNNTDKKFVETLAPYRDGRLMTRVFMGVNDNNSNWKTYGEHPYWMKFVDKDYKKLLQIVRKQITNYVVKQGGKYLELENKRFGQIVKKQKNEK